MGMTKNVKILSLKLVVRFDEQTGLSVQLFLLRYNEDRSSGPNFNRAGGFTGFTGLQGSISRDRRDSSCRIVL